MWRQGGRKKGEEQVGRGRLLLLLIALLLFALIVFGPYALLSWGGKRDLERLYPSVCVEP